MSTLGTSIETDESAKSQSSLEKLKRERHRQSWRRELLKH